MLFALGGSDVTGTDLRPDRFKSNGLDGGFAPEIAAASSRCCSSARSPWSSRSPRDGPTRATSSCARFAALLAFVTLGKVLSPQYVIWLAPFAALAYVWGQRLVAALVGAAIVLTHVEFPSRYFDLVDEQTDVILVVAARNVFLLAALVALVARLAWRDERVEE